MASGYFFLNHGGNRKDIYGIRSSYFPVIKKNTTFVFIFSRAASKGRNDLFSHFGVCVLLLLFVLLILSAKNNFQCISLPN